MRKRISLVLGAVMLLAATAAAQGCFFENPNGGWQPYTSYRDWRGWHQDHRHYSCDRFGNNCVQW